MGSLFFLAHFEPQAEGLPVVCPRQLLKKVVKKAATLGYVPKVGPEPEFFLTRAP